MTSPHAAQLLSVNPMVAVADGFLAPETCSQLIDLARLRLSRSQIGSDDAMLEESAARTGSDAHLAPAECSEAAAVMQRVAALVALPLSHGEGLSVLHYGPGQAFTAHLDGIWSGADAAAQSAFAADGGQRLFTAILYLNTVAAGGGTVFPKLGLRIPPLEGRLLLFANTSAGERDACPRSV
ncbi:MAG: 2OG-Fe(II) oxygenase, partial [Pseudomonadota bacterium]